MVSLRLPAVAEGRVSQARSVFVGRHVETRNEDLDTVLSGKMTDILKHRTTALWPRRYSLRVYVSAVQSDAVTTVFDSQRLLSRTSRFSQEHCLLFLRHRRSYIYIYIVWANVGHPHVRCLVCFLFVWIQRQLLHPSRYKPTCRTSWPQQFFLG